MHVKFIKLLTSINIVNICASYMLSGQFSLTALPEAMHHVISNEFESMHDYHAYRRGQARDNSTVLNPTRNFTASSSPNASSVNFIDNRKPVTIEDNESWAIGNLVTEKGECTVNVVNIEGYETISGLPLLLSAAHCTKGRSSYEFYFEYLDSNEASHIYYAPQAKAIHSFQGDDENWQDDVILFELPTSMPTEIHPLPVSLSDNISGRYYSYGYSSDKIGLSRSYCGSVMPHGNQSRLIKSHCDITSGASGGPLFRVDSDGQKSVFAVNTRAGLKYQFISQTYHVRLTADMLESVKFLRKTPPIPSPRPVAKTWEIRPSIFQN